MTDFALKKEIEDREKEETTMVGFWIYLMTDLIMFGVLFSTYAVLHTTTFNGPTGGDIFHLPYVLVETLVLLTSSFTVGLSVLMARKGKVRSAFLWLVATLLLGGTFLGMEIYEFTDLVRNGASYTQSAFLSSYFALVGTHGLHIAVGLLWIIVLLVKIGQEGMGRVQVKRLTLFSLFWHFLDIVWIVIFTMVYLTGSIK